jgi:hypothetical protein
MLRYIITYRGYSKAHIDRHWDPINPPTRVRERLADRLFLLDVFLFSYFYFKILLAIKRIILYSLFTAPWKNKRKRSMYIPVIGAAAALLRSVFPVPEDHQREYKTWGVLICLLCSPPPHTHTHTNTQSNTVSIPHREKVVILFPSVYLEMGRQLALKAHIEKIKRLLSLYLRYSLVNVYISIESNTDIHEFHFASVRLYVDRD